MTSAAPRLALRDVSVRYPGATDDALHGISLSLASGELAAIMGGPGAGATTLALIAAGLVPRPIRATVAGEVAFAPGVRPAIVVGRPASQLTGARPTVREEVAFGLENLGVPRPEMDRRIDAALDAVGIAALADRAPETLSGGEQGRLAIAAGLAMAPGLLVLDDPAAHLDPVGVETLAGILSTAADEGMAIVAAARDSGLLARASRAVLLDRGRIMADDVPGIALAGGAARSIGAQPPSVTLAAALGLDPRRAFDETALVDALRDPARGAARAAARDAMADSAGDIAVSWSPVRGHPPAEIELTNLTHRYPDGPDALRGVDLTIGEGEVVVLVGANGSGKTTLVKHLDGLLRPTTGTVRVAGTDVTTLPVHRNASVVGMAFADPAEMLFGRTVEAELRFGPRALGLPVAETGVLVEAALVATGLTELRDANPHDLGPARQRLVALAAVLATDPAVVVLDEPTGGLDPASARRVGSLIDALRDAGRTVVVVTHDMDLAAGHADRIVVLREGRVVALGSPREVFDPERAAVLAAAGIRPPLAVRLGGHLGVRPVPLHLGELLDRLGGRSSPRRTTPPG